MWAGVGWMDMLRGKDGGRLGECMYCTCRDRVGAVGLASIHPSLEGVIRDFAVVVGEEFPFSLFSQHKLPG